MLALVGGLAVGVPSAAAAELKGSFRGDALGTAANAKGGDVAVSLGRSAFLPCPCKGTFGNTISNRVDSVAAGDDGKVAKIDAVLSTIRTAKTASTATNTSTSTISGVNLLNGLITATTVKGISTTDATATKLGGTASGSTFVNLKVAGRTIAADVAPGTVINLAGIGTLTLKKVTNSGDRRTVSKTVVEMVVIDVKVANSLKLAVGSRITVAHAFSGYSRTQPTLFVGGQAYATSANSKIGSQLENDIGRGALVTIGCEGTDGKTRTNNLEDLAVGNVLSLGTGVTTAIGGKTSTGAMAKTTATVESVWLLNCLILATAVKAVAAETVKNGVRTRSTDGTEFVGLKVLGVARSLNVPAITRITLPGLGYVIVNEQVVPSSGGRTSVNGLRIVITTLNQQQRLPVGSEIVIAHADAFVQG